MAFADGPSDPDIDYNISFSWEERPGSPWDNVVVNKPPKMHDLFVTLTYKVKCAKETDAALNKLSELEHLAVLAPSEFGGSLYFKSFGDGNKIKSYSDNFRQLISSQELWPNGDKRVELSFVCRTQFFDAQQTPHRAFNTQTLPAGYTIPAPPAPVIEGPFAALKPVPQPSLT